MPPVSTVARDQLETRFQNGLVSVEKFAVSCYVTRDESQNGRLRNTRTVCGGLQFENRTFRRIHMIKKNFSRPTV